MKKSHRLIAVFCVIAIFFSILCIRFNAATIYKSDGYLYSITALSRSEIHGRESTEANVVIPKDFNDYYVTEIVDSAFSGDENIVSLRFSKAVLLERIGYYAFANCRNLSGTVNITGKITNVGISAFQDCSSLEGIAFRNPNISTIYAQTCYNCTSLSYIELPERLQTIEKYAFANTALKEVKIPRSVTYIDPTAFDGCEGLVISCYTDSAAHQFAVDNGYEFILLDAPIPTEPPTEAPTEALTEAPTEAPTEIPTSEPTEAPTTAPTEQPTDPGYYILGDTNNNYEVDVEDATFIQRVLAELSVPYSMEIIMHGDVDSDNELAIIDATYIQRFLAEMTIIFPVGDPVTK